MPRTREDLLDDDPITLAEASELVLRGAVTVSTLRAEIRRGNLTVERIGKNLFTTPAYIRQMRERCRVQQGHQSSTVQRSLSAADLAEQQAALTATIRALKNGSLGKSKGKRGG